MNADLIAVVQRGAVVELGSHQQLMNQQGVYWALAARQQTTAAFSEQDTREEEAGGINNGTTKPTSKRTLRDSVLRRGSVRLSIIPQGIQDKLNR